MQPIVKIEIQNLVKTKTIRNVHKKILLGYYFEGIYQMLFF